MRTLTITIALFIAISGNIALADNAPTPNNLAAISEVVSAEFGLFNSLESGKPTFVPATTVPLVPDQAYGWVIVLRTIKPTIKWREEFALPTKPSTWGDSESLGGTSVSGSGRVATTEKEVSPDGGIIFHSWSVAPGDPTGRYVIRVYVDEALVRTFEFDVQ